MFKALKKIPVPLAVGFMALCLVLAVGMGNANALEKAVGKAEKHLPEIEEMLESRRQSAENLLVLCERYGAGEVWTQAVVDARDGLKYAQGAEALTEANNRLTFVAEAAHEAMKPLASEQDMRLLTGVMDTLKSDQRIFERAAEAYNRELEKVEKVYNSLPTRFLLSMPEAYR